MEKVQQAAAHAAQAGPDDDGFYASVATFEELGLRQDLCAALSQLGFCRPSDIQARAYRAVTSDDAAAGQQRGTELFIGDCAGSGKTLAYLLPLLDAIEGRDGGAPPLQGLVIVPSPELARQAVGLLRRLRARGGFQLQTIGLTTGSETPSQRAQLLAGADVAVGTPQRLAALVEEGRLDVGAARAVALDEVDVLLGDAGLAAPTRRLLDAVPSSALRVAASASLPPALAAALRALWPGVRTVAGPRLHLPAPAALRGARVLDCSDPAASIGASGLKAAALARLLARGGSDADPPSSWTRALVFANKIGTCRELEAFLTHRDRRQRLPKGTRTLGFHAATPPHLRKAHLKLFVGAGDLGDPAVVGAQGSGTAEQGKSSPAPVVLVATDRAARGLDTVGIDHVILFDLPRDPSEFLRRVGRAARGPHRGRCRVTVLTCSDEILGTGGDAPSTAPSVLLFFDRQRYLFNMGEGYQRYCVERRLKLSRISALLLTRAGAATTGGLPGALLTMADSSAGGLLAGQAGLTVHGPRGLGDLVNAYRTFVNLKDLGLRLDEYEDGCARPAIANELVTITPVLVVGGGKEEATEQEASQPDAKRARVEEASAGAHSTPAHSPDVAVSYVAELPAVPGKFLPQRAAALGVPRGPAYGRLVRGESVTATSGAVVTPEDVMEPGTPGPAVLVVDCPTAAHLASLVAAPALRAWAADAEKSARLQLVVHLAPAEVVCAPAYAAWAAGFPATATHVLASLAPRRGLPVMRSAAAMQAKLNALAPTVFPLQRTLTDAEAEEPALPDFGGTVVPGRDMLRFHLRPVAKRGLDSAEVPAVLSAKAIAAELRSGDTPIGAALIGLEGGDAGNVDGSSAEAAAKPASTPTPPACLATSGRHNLEITFLGTGAAIPSKYRNVTGTLVDLFDRGALLVDCGEGSLGQLERSLGEEACAALLRRLRAVWISHVHADHHVGLLSVLSARQAALEGADSARVHDPLIVIAPRTLRRAIAVYASLLPGSVRWLDTAATLAGAAASPEDAAALAALREAMGLTQLRSLAVEHCAQAYGLVLERADAGGEPAPSNGNTGDTPTPSPPFKVVFSGDTRPCEAVVAAAEGATLLVHEATFEDELADEAEAKNHCTTAEAIGVAARAGAFRTILTHFSQRYPKIPVIDVNFQDSIAIAFDLMRVNLVDLPDLPKLVPKLKILFAEGEDGEDGATAA